MAHVHGLLFDLDGVIYCAKCGDVMRHLKIDTEYRYDTGRTRYIRK
jgi:hypothetical protein